MVTISMFAVAPADDGAFVAGWERERMADAGAVLLRALRADVEFRFVELVPGDGPPPFSGSDPRSRAQSAVYEVARSDGDVDGAGGALLVEPYGVPRGEDEAFLAGWRALRDELAGRRGYLGSRLHRAAGPAALRWISLVRWSSPLMLARAQRDRQAAPLPFAAHPALYQPLERSR
jgi:hypothetical protein